jgi:hypothetical protein
MNHPENISGGRSLMMDFSQGRDEPAKKRSFRA